MDIKFFFEYGGTIIQLPVNPSEIGVSYEGNSKKAEIIRLGEISIIKSRKLSSISFESFFPGDTWFPAINTLGAFQGPKFYTDFFNKVFEDAKPLRFIVTGVDINMLVSLEKFKPVVKAGEEEDVYYDISLQEYRSYGIVEVPLNTPTTTTTGATSATVTGQSATAARAATEITIGATVILNGQLFRDSYGSHPGKTFKNYKGKVNFINKKGSHPYHITTPSGGWLGWVTRASVTLV